MIKIIRKNGRTSLSENIPLSDTEQYVLLAYSYSLPFNGEYSFKEFADVIKQVFDQSNVFNQIASRAMEILDTQAREMEKGI